LAFDAYGRRIKPAIDAPDQRHDRGGPVNADRVGAIAVAGGPLLLLVAIFWHPFIPDLTDKQDVARHMEADPATWFGAHLAVAIGAAVLLLGFLAVRSHVRSSVGREPWTARAIPPLVIGSFLFALLPAMEIAMLAVHDVGGDLVATNEAMDKWFIPILLAGSVAFGAGSVLFAIGVRRADILPRRLSWLVFVAFVASAASRFAPMTLPLRIGIVALVVAMLPLAVTMWKAGGARHSATVAA
jgi:hypothetical protein